MSVRIAVPSSRGAARSTPRTPLIGSPCRFGAPIIGGRRLPLPHGCPQDGPDDRRMRSRAMTVAMVQAAVLERYGQPLAIEDVRLDPPGAGEVLVRMTASG